MSRVVDNRVVEMEFDNSNFEKNVGTSLSTLDKLKAALSFKGTEDDFGLVERAAEGVGKSFSLMEQVATGALRSFGTKLEAWATNTVKTMSGVNNVIEGMDKFEKITKSSATLLAQGFSTKEVRKELNKLNWFTDETSYNLTDMVDNISKFTATGQGLQESADAMMGIALWAAKAGQDAPTASRAMYQLSQAMGAYMRKEDWKSVQNANMDMKEFRQVALDTAVEMKTLKKNTDGTYQSLVATSKAGAKAFSISQFADSLTEGAWFTPDVMMKVYSKYNKAAQDIYGYMQKHVGATVQDAIDALGKSLDEFSLKAFLAGQEARTWGDAVASVKDALSTKWMGIFQHIFGSSKQATKFFTDLAYAFYDMFVEPMSGVVESFHKWRNAFGRKEWQNSLVSMLESINTALNAVRTTFDKFIFGDRAKALIRDARNIRKAYQIAGISEDKRKGPDVLLPERGSDGIIEARAQALLDLTHKFTAFSEKVQQFNEDTSFFERLTKGLLSTIGLVKLAISGLWTALDPFKPLVKDVLGWAVNRVLDLADAISGLYSEAKANNTFVKIFTSILKPFVTLKDKIGEFIDKFVPRFQERWSEFAKHFSFVGEKVDGLKQKFSGFADSVKSKWENLFSNWDVDKTIDGLFSAFSKVKAVVYDLIGVSDDEGFANWLEVTYKKAAAWVQKFRADAKSTFGSILDDLKGYWTKAKAWLDENWGTISSIVSGVFDTVWGFLKGFWASFSKVFDNNGDGSVLQKAIDGFKKFGSILGNIFQTILDGLKPIIDGIRNTIESMNFENAGEFLKGGGIAALGLAFLKWSTGFRKSSWLQAFSNILEGLGDVLGGFTRLLDAKALKDAAIGIGILVASLLLLIAVPPEDLAKAASVIASIILILSSSLKRLGGLKTTASIDSKGFNFSKSGGGGSILVAALAFVAIAGVLAILAAIPEKPLYRAATIIAVIAGILTLMLKAIANIYGEKGDSKNNYKNNYKNKIASGNALVKVGGPASVIFSFALFITAVVFAIKKMTEMLDNDERKFYIAAGIVGAITIALAAFLAVVGKFYKESAMDGTSSGPSKALWKNILAISTGIYIVAMAFEKIATINATKNRLLGAGAFILLFMGMMAAVLLATQKANLDNIGAFTKNILAISVAIGIVGLVVSLLASSTGNIKDAYVAVGIIGGVFGGLALVATKFKTDESVNRFKKFAEAIVIISAGVLLAAGALYALAEIDSNKVGNAIVLLLVIFGAFTAAGALGKFLGDGLIKFSKALALIAGAVALVAVGFLAAAEAIRIFSDSQLDVEKAAENISRFIDQIVSKIPQWSTAILTSLLGTLLSAIPATVTAVVDAISATLAGLVEEDPVTGKMKIESIVDNAIKIAVAVIDGITKNMSAIVNSVGGMIISLLGNLATWVETNREDISKNLAATIDGFIGIILDLFDPLGKKIFGKAWDGPNGVKTKLQDDAKVFLEVTVLKWLGGWVTSFVGVLNPISTKISSILGSVAKLIAAHPALTAIVGSLAVAGALTKEAVDEYHDYNENLILNIRGDSDEERKRRLRLYYQNQGNWSEKDIKEAFDKGLDVDVNGRALVEKSERATHNVELQTKDLQILDPNGAFSSNLTFAQSKTYADIDAYLAGLEREEASSAKLEPSVSITVVNPYPESPIEQYRKAESEYAKLRAKGILALTK